MYRLLVIVLPAGQIKFTADLTFRTSKRLAGFCITCVICSDGGLRPYINQDCSRVRAARGKYINVKITRYTDVQIKIPNSFYARAVQLRL